MNIQVILTVTMLLTLTLAAGVPTIASAPYLGNVDVGEEAGANILEEVLRIQSSRVTSEEFQGCGPVLAPGPNSALMIIGTTLLGGIGAVFFIKGRSGKYAAIGRG